MMMWEEGDKIHWLPASIETPAIIFMAWPFMESSKFLLSNLWWNQGFQPAHNI